MEAQEFIIRFNLNSRLFRIKDIPVSVEVLPEIAHFPEQYALYEVTGNSRIRLPFQPEMGKSPVIWFILPEGKGDKKGNRIFIVVRNHSEMPVSQVSIMRELSTLKLMVGDSPVLEYHMGVTEAPKGANPLYRRSGFIHPLWSPEGEELTNIQPADHFHHYGIWNPWTKTLINGREVDFWNLAKGQGTVKYEKILSLVEGCVFGGFQAYHEHIDYQAIGPDQIALNEIWDVKAWNRSDDNNRQIIDFSTSLYCPLDSGIIFAAYRYGGGLGYRATEKWHPENSSVTTSEGKNRVDSDDTRARWTIIEGESGQGRSGTLFLSHPSNFEHPEPIRVSPPESNNGRIFFNISPTKRRDWKIEPKREYKLHYRMVVFDGNMSIEEAEEYWKVYAEPLQVFPGNKR